MTQPWSAHRVIAKQMRKLREDRGWSAQKLGEAMQAVGIAWDRSIVANLESGRRQSISVEEFLALAYLLQVAPVHLLVPIEDEDQGPYAIAPDLPPVEPMDVREWVRGVLPVPGVDPRRYRAQVPPHEFLIEPFGARALDGVDRRPKATRKEPGDGQRR